MCSPVVLRTTALTYTRTLSAPSPPRATPPPADAHALPAYPRRAAQTEVFDKIQSQVETYVETLDVKALEHALLDRSNAYCATVNSRVRAQRRRCA